MTFCDYWRTIIDKATNDITTSRRDKSRSTGINLSIEGSLMKRYSKRLIIATLFVPLLFAQLGRRAQSGTNSTREASAGVEVTYIANEGVLISAGDRQVLIDGLHRKYQPDYLFPSPELLKQMETAQAPFDQIDLVLVSHIHLDHFHGESVGLHLKNNRGATLVSSQQVAEGVEKEFADYSLIKSRVKAMTPAWKEKREVNINGIDLTILGLRHGTERFYGLQNLGHIVRLGGKKFLHIGDAEQSVENFEGFHLPQEQIDIAFIPYWFLLFPPGQTIVRDYIKPRHIIAVHISPRQTEEVSKKVNEAFPDAVCFTKSMEKRVY